MGIICSGKAKNRKAMLPEMIRQLNTNTLLDQWPSTFIYLLKQKFQSVAHFQEDGHNKHDGMDYAAFMKLFPLLQQQPLDVSHRAFRSFDIDHSTYIDFKEFCTVLSLILNAEENQRTAFIFQLYDLDDDLCLNRAEFKHFIRANLQLMNCDSPQKQKCDEPRNINTQITTIINSVFDQNQSTINLKDFQEWITRNFDIIKYFEIFELVPGPIKEREILRSIIKYQAAEKQLSQKHYYIISYKWRFYVNYNYAEKSKNEQILNINEVKSVIGKLSPIAEKKQSKITSIVSIVDLDFNIVQSETKELEEIIKNQPNVTFSPDFKIKQRMKQSPLHKHTKSVPITQWNSALQEEQPQEAPSLTQPYLDLINGTEILMSSHSKVIESVQSTTVKSSHHPSAEFNQINSKAALPLFDTPDHKQNLYNAFGSDSYLASPEVKKSPIKEVVNNIECAAPEMVAKQSIIRDLGSSFVDSLCNPPLDDKLMRYGICETEEDKLYEKINVQMTLRPGSIDNSDLEGEYEGELKLNILNNHDYVLVPEEAWFSLVQWYGLSGCGVPVFRRKVFQDTKRNLNILDMYPPYLRAYDVDSHGGICHSKKMSKMVSARNTVLQCYKKFSKFMKLGQVENRAIYIRRIGKSWQCITDLFMRLMDYHIETGTMVAFVPSKYASAFETTQCVKDDERVQLTSGSMRLGALYDVHNTESDEWVQGHVSAISDEGIHFHVRRQSYLREFVVEHNYVKLRVDRLGRRSEVPVPRTVLQEVVPGLRTLFPGLRNQGNTCFMNTILQCLVYTPLFRDYLINETFKDDLVVRKSRGDHKQQKTRQSYLTTELSKLTQKMQQFRSDRSGQMSIVPYDLKKTVDTLLPQFSGYEQHDAQEFLCLFLDSMSDELKKKNEVSVIQELFMGKTVNELQCCKCLNRSVLQEAFFTLSLPIPINEELYFEVTFVPRCSKYSAPPLLRYGVKVSKYAALVLIIKFLCEQKDFIVEFEKVSGVSHMRFEFAEVYRNSIHKSFFGLDVKTKICHLGMKPYDQIYAYEILKVPKDLEDEYGELIHNSMKNPLKVDDFIDVQDIQGEWRYGQIREIKKRYDEQYFRVQVRYDKQEISQWITSHSNQIAPFRSKVVNKRNAIVLNAVHRINNLAKGTLDKFALPFLITVPQWLTFREFSALVFSQIKRFIDFTYFKRKITQIRRLKEIGELNPSINNNSPIKKEYNDSILRRIQTIMPSAQSFSNPYEQREDKNPISIKNPSKQSTEKLQKSEQDSSKLQDEEGFEFFEAHGLPYCLRLIDIATLCCVTCDKPISYIQPSILPNNSSIEKYCWKGHPELIDAPLSMSQINSSTPLIALDWLDSLVFNPFSIQAEQDESYRQLKYEKANRKDRISVEQCFDLMTAEVISHFKYYGFQEKLEIECDNCKSLQPATTKFSLSQLPNILVLHLKRFQYRDGYLEKIENDIDFPLKTMNLKDWTFESVNMRKEIYDLYAVANHMGNGQEGNQFVYFTWMQGHYTSYVLLEHEGKEIWVNFDDDSVRLIPKEKVMSQYTYLLFYRRREFSSSAIINLTFKTFEKKKISQ